MRIKKKDKNNRFILENVIFDGYSIKDTLTGGYYCYDEHDLDKLCKLLNQLYDENTELHRDNNRLRECIIEIYIIAKNEEV